MAIIISDTTFLQDFKALIQENPSDEAIFAFLKGDKSSVRAVTFETFKSLIDISNIEVIIDGTISAGDYIKFKEVTTEGDLVFQAGSLNENGDITSSKSIIVPPASLQIGGIVLTEAGSFLEVKSNIEDSQSFIVERPYTILSGSSAPTVPDVTGEVALGNQLLDDEESIRTTNSQLVQTSEPGRDAYLTRLEIKVKGPVSNLFIEVRIDSFEGDLVSTAGPVSISQGANDVSILNIPYNNRLHALDTVTYYSITTVDADYIALGHDFGGIIGFVPWFQNYGLNTVANDIVLLDTDIGTDIGDIVQLEDVGGSPSLPAVDGSQVTGVLGVNSIYGSDGSINLGTIRIATANDNSEWHFVGYDTNSGTFTDRGFSRVKGDSLDLRYAVGDGAGGTLAFMDIVLSPTGQIVADTVNNKGLEGAADFSANYVANSYVQESYVNPGSNNQIFFKSGGAPSADVNFVFNGTALGVGNSSPNSNAILDMTNAGVLGNLFPGATTAEINAIISPVGGLSFYDETTGRIRHYNAAVAAWRGAGTEEDSFYLSDGTITGESRVVDLESTSNLTYVNYGGQTSANWTGRSRAALLGSNLNLSADIGNGAGGLLSENRIVMSPSFATLIDDDAHQTGLRYNLDYSGTQSAGDRWLVDKGYADIVKSTDIIYVRSESDLPAPVSGVITVGSDDTYFFLNSFTLTANNRFVLNGNVAFLGFGINTTKLTGNSTSTLITNTGPYRLEVRDLWIEQTGAGNLLDINDPDADLELIDGKLTGGAISVTNSAIFLTVDSVIQQAPVTFVSGGAVTNIVLNDTTMYDLGSPFDLLTIEDGHTVSNIIQTSGAFFLFNGSSRGIVTTGTPVIGRATLASGAFIQLAATSVGIDLENPESVGVGLIDNYTFTGFGIPLVSSPVSSSNFATITNNTRGCTVDDDGNLITIDITTDLITRYVGLTSTVDTSIAAPASNVQGIAWYKGDLYSVEVAGLCRRHDGFSTTILDSFTPADSGISMVFIGIDVVILSGSADTIKIYDGFSATVKTSFATPTTLSQGIAYDGINIIVCDSDNPATIHVLDGSTGNDKYTFDGPVGDVKDMNITDGGFVMVNTVNAYLFNHTITFDHSSPTWQLTGIPGIQNSSDRGGVNFESTAGVTLTPPGAGTWFDIADAGVDIFYGNFAKNEKCYMDDEKNGQIIWTGALDRGRTIAAHATISRAGPTSNVFFELVIAISKDGGSTFEEITDSIGVGVLPTNTDFVTLNTIPLVRGLDDGDLIKVRIRNVTNTNNINVFSVALAIS